MHLGDGRLIRPARASHDDSGFAAHQRNHFARVESGRFRWQTEHPYVSDQERELLVGLMRPASGLVLEVGCGEGANLRHLGVRSKRSTAVDFSLPRAAFCRSVNPDAGVLCADARALPFPDGGFDLVFCRDLLHHVPAEGRAQAVAEMHRVCARDGSMVLIEANGLNPLISAHGLLIPHERGERDTSPDLFLQLVSTLQVEDVNMHMAKPLPVYLLLFHHRFGLPVLGRWRPTCWLIDAVMRLAGRLLPPRLWAYCILSARKSTRGVPR